jgi:hypothetical protein
MVCNKAVGCRCHSLCQCHLNLVRVKSRSAGCSALRLAAVHFIAVLSIKPRYLLRPTSVLSNMSSNSIAMLKSLSQPNEGRSSSVPPSQTTSRPRPPPTGTPPPLRPHNRIASEPPVIKGPAPEATLDLTGLLERSGPSVVKTRTGSVLSRGFILKTDYYPSGTCRQPSKTRRCQLTVFMLGRALDLELNVHGAPNFRAPRQGAFNVFGAAQPRTQGLRAILSILRCRPGTPNPSHVVWFSTREEPIGKYDPSTESSLLGGRK